MTTALWTLSIVAVVVALLSFAASCDANANASHVKAHHATETKKTPTPVSHDQYPYHSLSRIAGQVGILEERLKAVEMEQTEERNIRLLLDRRHIAPTPAPEKQYELSVSLKERKS